MNDTTPLPNHSQWLPSASLTTIKARAALLAQIRTFFVKAGVMEVETPTCSVYANTDPAIESMSTNFLGPGYPAGLPLFLHTSPEFFMKRLLAAGSGPIYQICRAYRNGERGRLHSPEFSILEWYRPDFDYHQLIDELTALIEAIAGKSLSRQKFSYAELFQTHFGIDPHSSDVPTLRNCALKLPIAGVKSIELPDRDAWLDLLLTHGIESQLPNDVLTFVYDYPTSQAALSNIRISPIPVAERFELYIGAMELANGFNELRDAEEQQRRFNADLEKRRLRNQPQVPIDRDLLAALSSGIPSCSGVALGLDRLLMWLSGIRHIDQVLAFSTLGSTE